VVKVGKSVDLQPDKRFHQHIRDHAIGDVYDALVELITNADDSYSRLFQDGKRRADGGDILIEYEERRRRTSRLVIRDRAEGMNAEEMYKCLARPGAYSSRTGNRGYMGRGAKDCTALGTLTYESIKDDKYYRCSITPDFKFTLEAANEKVTPAVRGRLGIERGNGTSVTLQLLPECRLPRFRSLADDLPWHFALRDLMAESSATKIILKKVGASQSCKLVHRPPEGRLVINESFQVPGYPDARATLMIWRAPEPLEQYKPRFERFGILVKSTRAIHECSLLHDDIKADPNARRYFGRLECPYVDSLMEEYEECRAAGKPHRAHNPRLIVDPNRRSGLDRRHPFVEALLQIPIKRLHGLLTAEREASRARQRNIANAETKARLHKLARLAGRFLQQQLDGLEELTADEAADQTSFAKTGVLLYPTYFKLGLGQERTVTYYAHRAATENEGKVSVTCEPANAIQLAGVPFSLTEHRKRRDLLVGTFKVVGAATCDGAILTASKTGAPNAEALANVVEMVPQDRLLSDPLEFEHKEYRVKVGTTRSIRLYARVPESVSASAIVRVSSDDEAKVQVRGSCTLQPVEGTNYAEGSVVVHARTLGSNCRLTAEVAGHRAVTRVRVVDKPETTGVPIRIELVPDSFGSFRAQWATHEGKPNLLKVSATHPSLARYLGSESQGYPGQTSVVFRLLLAEIVAESVCRKSLSLEAQERPWEFPWVDLKDPHMILDSVVSEMHRRLVHFIEAAHSTMVDSAEIRPGEGPHVGSDGQETERVAVASGSIPLFDL